MKLRIVVDEKPYEVDVDFDEDDNARGLADYVPPYSPASRVTVTPPAPPIASGVSQTPSAAYGSTTAENHLCRCPMAGIVIKVNVQVGQEIQVNDLLMVLEAMKMETNITAPLSGKVKAINAQSGDAVQVGQALVEFE